MGRKPIGDRPLTNAEHQAKHRRKLALKKRKEIAARLGIDLAAIERGIFPRAPSDDEADRDEQAVELEPCEEALFDAPLSREELLSMVPSLSDLTFWKPEN